MSGTVLDPTTTTEEVPPPQDGHDSMVWSAAPVRPKVAVSPVAIVISLETDLGEQLYRKYRVEAGRLRASRFPVPTFAEWIADRLATVAYGTGAPRLQERDSE